MPTLRRFQSSQGNPIEAERALDRSQTQSRKAVVLNGPVSLSGQKVQPLRGSLPYHAIEKRA